MLPGASTPDQTPVDDITDSHDWAYTRAAQLLPDQDLESRLRLATWLLDGTVVLDPQRIAAAARALAATEGRRFDAVAAGMSAERSRWIGQAVQVVTAYCGGDR